MVKWPLRKGPLWEMVLDSIMRSKTACITVVSSSGVQNAPPYCPYFAGPSCDHLSQTDGVLECHGRVEGEGEGANEMDGGSLCDFNREEDVDMFIEMMGFIVSDNKGKEVKLSKFMVGISYA